MSGHVTRVFGEWKGSSAAGSDRDALFKNPKFMLDIPSEGMYLPYVEIMKEFMWECLVFLAVRIFIYFTIFRFFFSNEWRQ